MTPPHTDTGRERSGYVVHKFRLPSSDSVVPVGTSGELLSCGVQGGAIVVWASVDPDAPVGDGKQVLCINTGSPLPPWRRFLGTVTIESIVWHVFEGLG